VIAGIIATKLLVGREDWVLSDHLPGRLGMTACGFLVGLASSLMGISGGSLATMALTLYARPIHNAVATSAGLGVPITIAAPSAMCWPACHIRRRGRRCRSALSRSSASS